MDGHQGFGDRARVKEGEAREGRLAQLLPPLASLGGDYGAHAEPYDVHFARGQALPATCTLICL